MQTLAGIGILGFVGWILVTGRVRGLTRILAVVAAAIVATWLVFSAYLPSYSHRYRLTVEIESDGQVRTGSSVIEVRWRRQPVVGDAPPWVSSIKGQAPLVDLDKRGVVLAMLAPGDDPGAVSADFLALRALGFFPNRPRSFPPDAEGLRRIANYRGGADLTQGNFPRFVWLSDLDRPDAAVAVDGSDLAAIVGGAARLVAVRIETTSDAVTTGLGRKLPWLRLKYERESQNGLTTRHGAFALSAHALNRGVDPD